MWQLIDPDRLRIGLAALAGAVVYGVFTLVTLFMTGQSVRRVDLIRALANVIAAAVTGVIVAVVIAPNLTLVIPFVHLRDTSTVAFFIGALTWEVLPFLLLGVRNRAKREAEKQGSVQ
jgi:hypothetical protein